MSIENLFKECAHLLTKHAMDGNSFRELSQEDKSQIVKFIVNAIDAYKNKDFSGFISNLLDLRDYQVNIYPEAFHPTYSDFFVDTGMWDWISSCTNKEEPAVTDWKAASFVMEDLAERIENNQIFG